MPTDFPVKLGPIALLLLAGACRSPEPPQPTPWPGSDERPTDFADNLDVLGFSELSLYTQHVSGAVSERPHFSERGAMGVGNGLAFTTLGLSDPANRMHGTVGPTYEKGSSGYFSDHWFTLVVDGQELEPDQEWIARARGTNVVVTVAKAGAHTLTTFDYAPQGVGGDPVPGIARIFVVDGPGDVSLRLHSTANLELMDDHVVQSLDDGTRLLGFLPWQGELVADGDTWAVQPDGRQAAMLFGTAVDTGGLDAMADRIAAADPDEWMGQTADHWADWLNTGVTVRTSDPRIDDLYEGMRVAIRVQQTVAGGVAPMNRYTRVWLRDTYGPARFYARAGLFDDAWATLDYLHLCHAVRGDYANSCDAGLTESDKGEEPNWAALPDLSGRAAAEGPSWVPLAYRDVVAFTGDDGRVAERMDYLTRAVLAQPTETGLQSFSGDETFRAALGSNAGLPIEYGWEELAWSANTSMLTVASADWLSAAAVRHGTGQATELADRAALASAALDTEFRTTDGWLAPYVFHTAGTANAQGDVAATPFEDVNLKPLWLGLVEPDAAGALDDLRAVEAHAAVGDGTVQSPAKIPLDLSLDGADLSAGIGTGMVPGFYLYDLAVVGDPAGYAAFDALHTIATPTGSYPEYIVHSDDRALQVIYDAAGGLGDTPARYRPWEAAINADAMLAWLTGLEPTADGMALRPHHVGELPEITVDGLRVGDHTLSYTSRYEAEHLIVTFSTTDTEPFRLDVDLPAPPQAHDIRSFGPSWGELQEAPGGEYWMSFAPVPIDSQEPLVFEITWNE